MKWRSSKHGWDDAMLSSAYPFHRSASEINCSCVHAQVVSCHGYLVFHPFVEQLTVFYISGLVLASFRDGEPPYTYGGLQSMPQPWPPSRGHHEYHVPKRYTNYSLVTRPSLALVLECLKYAKTEPEGLVNLTIKNWRWGRPGNEAMKTMRKSIYFIRKPVTDIHTSTTSD